MERNDFKCYCQHKNGRESQRTIMCGLVEFSNNKSVVGDFIETSRCNFDEWCTGPSRRDESIQGVDYGRNVLCTKGKC